jgi:hypothetical protein
MQSIEICNKIVQDRCQLLFQIVLEKTYIILNNMNIAKRMLNYLIPDNKIVERCIEYKWELCF